jgi:hypothetical protein
MHNVLALVALTLVNARQDSLVMEHTVPILMSVNKQIIAVKMPHVPTQLDLTTARANLDLLEMELPVEMIVRVLLANKVKLVLIWV